MYLSYTDFFLNIDQTSIDIYLFIYYSEFINEVYTR